MQYTVETIAGTSFDKCVYMVWHHAPSYERIPGAVEIQERALNEFCDHRQREVTAAMPLIERRIDNKDTIFQRYICNVVA